MKPFFHTLVIVAFLSLTSSFIFSQKTIPSFKQASSYAELEQMYKEIANHPEKYQGYKWMARWIEEQASRIDVNGNLPSLSILQKESEKFNALKKSTHLKFNNTWMPVGPDNAPEPFDNFNIKGSGRINTITFHPTDPNTMWIGGGQGGVWKSTDHGQSWIPIGDDLPVLRISSIAVNPDNPDEMYVALGDYAYITVALDLDGRNRNTHYGMGIYKTMDGGITWQPTGFTRSQQERDLSLTRKILIHPEDTDRLLAVGIHGAWKSTNAGTNWSQLSDKEYWDLEQSPDNPNVLYASTGFLANQNIGEVSILKSTDFGDTWTELQTGLPRTDEVERVKIAISHSDPTYVYAVACDLNGGLYGLYASQDAGNTWEIRSTEPNILHWGDGQDRGGQGSYDLAIVVDPNDPNQIAVGGINPWVSQDGGRTWDGAGYYIALFGPSIHADQHYYVYNPLDNYIYACHDGGVSRTFEISQGSWLDASEDPDYMWPTQWEHLDKGLGNLAFYRLGIFEGNPENIVAGAQDMGGFYRNNEVWNYTFLGDGMECIIHPENPDIVYGSTQFGRINKSTNGGLSSRNIRAWNTEFAAWTTPFKMDENNPNVIYAPVQNVWISEDGANNFTKTSDIPNEFPICAFAVSKSDSKFMYVAKRIYHSEDQPTQVFMTDDRGQSWIDITAGVPDHLFVKYMEVDDDDPLHAWLVLGGFEPGSKVYETLDGGQSWINISLNLPNLPANCIIHQNGTPSDALYVGMDRGVYYKDATMDGWEIYSTGLPNVIVTELEIHEPSQQIMISTFGRGVWRNNLIPENSTSTEEISHITSMNILPNPNDGQFSLQIQSEIAASGEVRIINVVGQTVYEQPIYIGQGSLSVALDIQGLNGGVYYINVRVGKKNQTLKFIKE